MFQIRDVNGVQKPYTTGEIRAKRNVRSVTAIGGVDAIVQSSEQQQDFVSTDSVQGRYQSGQAQQQERRVVLRAHEIMSNPVFTIPPSTSMSEANRILTKRRFRHLPVCSDSGLLVGLISDRDALKFNARALLDRTNPDDVLVSSIMVTGLLTATPDTLIREIARTLFEERIGSLPIMSESDKLEGIITRSDILRALFKHGPIQIWA